MKLLGRDKKQKTLKLLLTKPEDSWHAARLIDVGDEITAITFRALQEEVKKQEKKKILVTIEIEKISLEADTLRVIGIIKSSTNKDVPLGKYQSINLNVQDNFTLKKKAHGALFEKLLDYAINQQEQTYPLIIFERERALLGMLKSDHFERLKELDIDVEKKQMQDSMPKKGLQELKKEMQTLLDAHAHLIIAASPFWKKDLTQGLSKEHAKKIIFVPINSYGNMAIGEIMQRAEIQSILKEVKIKEEYELIERLKTAIKTDKPCAYGYAQVEQAAHSGAIEQLLLTDKLMKEKQEKQEFLELNALIDTVTKTKGAFHLLSVKQPPGKELQGLGGIAALLKFKIN